MPRLVAPIALAVTCLLAAGCGGDDPAPAARKPSSKPPSSNGCEKVAAPQPKPDGDLTRPKLRLNPAKRYVAVVDTSCGTFDITLDAKRAPKTGGSFTYLARKGFFDGQIFHRIVAGFVIQGGDPTGTGTGGPGYSVIEAPPKSLKYSKGVVAMAKTEAEAPGTSGSQFYVVTGADAGLPPDYALLGKVTRGLDVVVRIGTSPVGAQDLPVDPVVIRSVRIRTG